MASKMAVSFKVDFFCKAFSPVTNFPIHQAMLVQKLHDVTLASLNVLEKNHDGVRDGLNKQEYRTPELNIPAALCLMLLLCCKHHNKECSKF